jgi:cytochrome c
MDIGKFRHSNIRGRKLNSFELNKVMMALLLTVLIVIGINGLTEVIFDHEEMDSNAYPIEIAAAPADAAAPEAVVEQGPTFGELLAMASVEKGQKIFKKCKACHTNDKGGKNLVGPHLWNVVGRPKGSIEGYGYSDGMKNKGGNWTFEDLNAFLTKPGKFVAKTKMSFAGLKKPADRAAIIALLRSKSDAPVDLPAAPAPEPEAAE